MIDVKAEGEALDRDGFVRILNFIPKDQLDKIRGEVQDLRKTAPRVIASEHPVRHSFYPFWMFRHRLHTKMTNISSFFGDPNLRALITNYMKKDWCVSDVLSAESPQAETIILGWHTDASAPTLDNLDFYRVKLFIYLEDTMEENGCFSFVPGSHKVVHFVQKAMFDGVIPRRPVQAWAEFIVACDDLKGKMPADLWAIVEDMRARIKSDDCCTDGYDLPCPAGSIIIFDDRSMHRAGIPSGGPRSVLRYGCMGRDEAKWANWRNHYGRKVGRMITDHPIRNLLWGA